MPKLIIEQLEKRIEAEQLVQPFSLTVPEGTIVALCGGNGAGKSTIIRMVAGLTKQTSGSIKIDEHTIEANRQAYLSMLGYMPDDFQFSGGMTAYEALSFWGDLKGASRARVRELLELVGLQDTGRKKVQSFSKGMRQRLLLAQALLTKPPLLLLDEPTNGLDPFWMKQFVHILREAAKQGQSVLFSTHQLQVAEAVADYFIFLNNGKIELEGSYEDISSKHGEEGIQKAYASLFWGEEGPLKREAIKS